MNSELQVVEKRCWFRLFRKDWKPTPLKQPKIQKDFAKQSVVHRLSAVFRYSVLSLEYWISPGGKLREWFRFNAVTALFIGLPAMLIIPIITFLLTQFAAWTITIAKTLLLIPAAVLAFIGIISGLWTVRSVFRK